MIYHVTYVWYGIVACDLSCDLCNYNWLSGKPAAFDLSAISLLEAGVPRMAGSATERRKHPASDEKCMEVGWACTPMAAE